VRISGSNAGYTMFRGSVKSTGYPLHSPVSPSLPLPCVTVCRHVSAGVYYRMQIRSIFTWASLFRIEKCNFRFEREKRDRRRLSLISRTYSAVAWLGSGEDDRTACILRDTVDGISHFEVVYCLDFVHSSPLM